MSPRAIRWETANFPIPLSLQKDEFIGFPTTFFSFQGAMKANTNMLFSDTTEYHTLHTQLARARSVTVSFRRIKRSVSAQARTPKWEFIGEITVDGSVEMEEEDEEMNWFWFWNWRTCGSSSF